MTHAARHQPPRPRHARSMLAAIVLLLSSAAAWAQPRPESLVVGLLTALHPSPFQATFVRALGEHGFDEGRNLVVHRRYGEGFVDRLPALVTDLVAQKPQVIFTPSGPATRHVARVVTRIPQVVLDLEMDPVESGLAASISRPGGNVTGLFLEHADLRAKQIEFLRNVAPGLSRLAVLWDPATARKPLEVTERTAREMGIAATVFRATSAAELVRATSEIAASDADGLLVISSPLFFLERERIATMATSRKLPSITQFREYADAGGLLAYGPNLHEAFRRAASFVARIAAGAAPGDLPIERPGKDELVINHRTAVAIGVTVPTRLRMLANDAIR